MNLEVECPLCTKIGFTSVDALRIALVSAASRNLKCPVCNESLTGLDKLTIHLFGHTLPQHELQSVFQPVKTSNSIPHNETSMKHGSVLEHITVIPQELKKKVEISFPSRSHSQTIQTSQHTDDTPSNKLPGSTSVINQDYSSLLCWLPVTCLPEKLANFTPNIIGSDSSDVTHSGISIESQHTHTQNDGKGENSQVLASLERNVLSKDTPFIIVSLPSPQEMKKQSDLREISNITNNITNDLSLSDVSTLSGKLLMLHCNGSSQNTSNVSIDNSNEQSSVQIAVLPELQNQSHASSVEILQPHQDHCVPNRDVPTSVPHKDVKKNDIVEQNEQSSGGGPAKLSNEILRCNLCLSQFSDPNILTLHQQLVHGGSDSSQSRQGEDPAENKDENYQCHMCSKTFHMQGSLMVHLRVAHTTPTMVGLASRIKDSITEEPSACAISTPGMVTPKSTKDQPQAKNSDNKQWECSDCGKFFTTKYFLKKHKRLHTGEMPYSCPTCNKSFTFQQSYHKHLLYHSDEKPHTCTECGRSFKELSTLHNHQRIHTGEKPWACETCGKCFRQRVSYLVHRRIHTGAMPYCCTVCNKSFRYKVSQRTHKCVVQTPSTVTSQAGSLLEQLLFEAPEESQGKRREAQDKQNEEISFSHETQPEEVQSSLIIPPSNDHTSERETPLVYSSYNNDKPNFHQGAEPGMSHFNLQNFQLQQTLSDIQNGSSISQSNEVMQNASVSLKEEPKKNVFSEKSRVNTATPSWSPAKVCSPGQNSNSSSLVVLVNGKEMITSGLPDSSVPVSLLQVLQKVKHTHSNEFLTQASVSTNNLQSSAPCPETAKVGNIVLSNPFVPDFLSMASSASNPNPNPMTGCGSTNVSMGGDLFQWDVSVGLPRHDNNDSTTDNVSASQEAMDSLQSLLFGSHSTDLCPSEKIPLRGYFVQEDPLKIEGNLPKLDGDPPLTREDSLEF